MALKDQKMHDRINCLIDSAADQPYVEVSSQMLAEVCSKIPEDDKQNNTYRDVQTMLFDHTQKVILVICHKISIKF